MASGANATGAQRASPLPRRPSLDGKRSKLPKGANGDRDGRGSERGSSSSAELQSRSAALSPIALPISKFLEQVNVSRSTAYRLAAAGEIVLLKIGRRTLVDMASVRAFLARAPHAALRR
ncbi:helix-turn-helix domain-containing protein [Dankookia sp. P2]|uniref:helix-turn-helix domain-containing protein n=1 Tax=Dankookia sp. P2 TaxID=3423955 RepID=UPI003D67CB94